MRTLRCPFAGVRTLPRDGTYKPVELVPRFVDGERSLIYCGRVNEYRECLGFLHTTGTGIVTARCYHLRDNFKQGLVTRLEELVDELKKGVIASGALDELVERSKPLRWELDS